MEDLLLFDFLTAQVLVLPSFYSSHQLQPSCILESKLKLRTVSYTHDYLAGVIAS